MTKIEIITKKVDLERQINESLKKRLNKTIDNSLDVFRKILQDFVQSTIENTSVWQSIAGVNEKGLDAHFGIWAGQNESIREQLLEIWRNQIRVKSLSAGNNLARVRLEAVKSDWAEISSSDAGKTFSENSGETLYWMDWLLNGNISLSSKINKYNITFDLKPGQRSRSGKAVMEIVKDDPYKFPIDLVGGQPDANNNFVTRAFQDTITNNNKKLRKKFMEIVYLGLQ